MVVTIEKLDHQGRGIAHFNGMTIFIPNALKGEVVEIELLKQKKNIAEAKVLNYQKISPDRVTPACPYFDICGGCDLMHLSISKQNLYKEEKVKEILTRYGNVEETVIKPLVSNPKPTHYRNKVTFQVKDGKLGFYKKKSNEVIPITHCELLDENMNEIIQVLKSLSLLSVTQIVVKKSRSTKDFLVWIQAKKPIKEEIFVSVLKPHITTLVINQKVLFGSGNLYETLGDKTFKISPESFFQVNSECAYLLYQKVKEYASLVGKEDVLDLYCGTGTIGIFISDKAKEVLGIELNEKAVKDAEENKLYNHVENITFICGDVSKKIEELKFKPDVIIVDPPRAGLDTHTREVIFKLHPKRIVYVSCDPMTFARDLKILQEKYKVLEITPFDMFSHTYHVENVCKLERK